MSGELWIACNQAVLKYDSQIQIYLEVRYSIGLDQE